MFRKSDLILLVICELFICSSASSISMDEKECPQICPYIYDPLCATNGQIYKEFSNLCDFEANNCRLERSGAQNFTSCAMDLCTTELVADLGDLLKKLYNVDLKAPECIKPCPAIYSPVCISNGKYRALVDNNCVAEYFNCVLARENKAAFTVLQNYSC